MLISAPSKCNSSASKYVVAPRSSVIAHQCIDACDPKQEHEDQEMLFQQLGVPTFEMVKFI